MARFLRRIALALEDLPASAARAPFDLPVNPLSHLLLRFQLTNVAPAAQDTYSAIDDLITQITDVTIRHNGENIIQGSLRDLMVINALVHHAFPGIADPQDTDNGVRSIVFPLCLGRRMFDPRSCFPATQRGNLQMLITAGADGAAYDDINMSVEAIELIEAAPESYLKYTTRSQNSVIGEFDVRLPIGWPLLGILLFDTGLFGSNDEVLSWGQFRLLKDNVEQYFAQCDFEVLAAETSGRLAKMGTWPGHVHQFFGNAAGDDDSDDSQVLVSHGYRGYGYLDFDPLMDGAYLLETRGASDLIIKATGDEATAIRTIPVEWVKLGA